MKITYIYRKPVESGFSIEKIFNSIADKLRESDEVNEYILTGRFFYIYDAIKLRKLRSDIYHITGGATFFSIYLVGLKHVTTIHDCGHLRYTLKGVKKLVFRFLWMKIPALLSNYITTVSEKTAEDLQKENIICIKNNRLKIIPNCIQFPGSGKDYKTRNQTRYVLAIGTKSQKNLERLIEAIALLKIKLVVVGKLNEAQQLLLSNQKVIYKEYIAISEEELICLYQGATLCAFVSVEGEGFGMPIIEAQFLGTPVVTSNIEPMQSVSGDGALHVDPYSVKSIALGISKVLESKEVAESLILKGYRNSVRYKIETVSAMYRDLYEKI